MSPKGSNWVPITHTSDCMKITMNDENIVSIAQLKSFLKEVVEVTFNINHIGNKNKQEMYDWVGTSIQKFRYFSLKKRERGIVLDYMEKITGRSRPQIKKLIKKKKRFGKIKLSVVKKHRFPVLYDTSDIARLVETDNAHGRLSGPATKRILEREYLVYNKLEYEKIYHISVPHIYNIRKQSRQYKSNVLFIAHTQAVKRNIGERRKPHPEEKPGFLRVDSVHQGDLDMEKGVYYINMVDEVTQWEIIGCVEGISEEFLTPLLLELLNRFPFLILNFHSDNGSEYINYQVADMLQKMMVDQTKSRSRRTNDNALVETKNGSVIRKHMGYSYIQKGYARKINVFFRNYMDDYLNFHRPSGFATDYVNDKGKIQKVYENYMTPYEKLISLKDFEQYLRPEVSATALARISKLQSDNESAQKMQINKTKLFKTFTV
jgi:transposase InsO family protein/phosphotransferase system IIB component